MVQYYMFVWLDGIQRSWKEKKKRKEPLQIHICAAGRDLPLLGIDVVEKTVGSGTKARGGKSRFLNLRVVFLLDINKLGLGEPTAASGREQWQGKPCLAGHS